LSAVITRTRPAAPVTSHRGVDVSPSNEVRYGVTTIVLLVLVAGYSSASAAASAPRAAPADATGTPDLTRPIAVRPA